MSFVTAFIAIKPVAIAAQTGVPDVFKLAYKLDKRFLVFPRIQDLKDLVGIDDVIFIVHSSEAPDLCEIGFSESRSIAIVVQAGESPLTRDDLSIGRVARLGELDGYRSPNAVADAAIALVKLRSIISKGTC